MFKPKFRYTDKIVGDRDVRDMFKLSDRAALKEVRKLVDLEVIKAEGKGRSLIYVLA